MLVNQVYEIWRAEDYMVSLLMLNITRTYNRVICRQLIHILKVKEILKNLANWVHSFMINKIITLMIKNYKIKKMLINVKIPQESLLSFIFYLFYVVKLLEACNNINKKLNTNKFINNINLLTYGLFMKCNCRTLIKTHDKCLDWAKHYKVFFNLKKYKFIHLSYTSYKFNMRAML